MRRKCVGIIKVLWGKTKRKARHFLKWSLIACLMGCGTGLVGTAFYKGLELVYGLRSAYPALLLCLPFGGLLIVGLYRLARQEKDRGTNTVIEAVRSEEEISGAVAPLMFASTLLTHLFGGSAGREGAALQIGGSIGNRVGKCLKLDRKDTTVVIMCGMSAAFSAVFGTPLAAAFFSMEVVSVGVMYYAALVPCVFASLIAVEIAKAFGAHPERFAILELPEFALLPAVKITVLAVLCAGLSVLFCVALRAVARRQKKWFPNPYARIMAAGAALVVLAWLLGTGDYLGTGMDVIQKSMEGTARPEAFIWKIVFTAVTLGAGYKGGEIVPSFFVGATFGCLAGQILGLSPSLCAAVGMIAVFCGVTNSPVTSLLIAFELFGMEGVPYFMIGVAVSYMLSGYYGLYKSQKIVYSKFRTEFVNRTAGE